MKKIVPKMQIKRMMVKLLRKKSVKSGLPPGTLVHVGTKYTDKVTMSAILYDEENFKEWQVDKKEDIDGLKGLQGNIWINVEGVHDLGIIETFGRVYNLHPLLLEDIMNSTQRPKIEDYGDYTFLVFKMLTFDDVNREVNIEQISLVLGKGYIITFQEGIEGDVFDPLRERLRKNKGLIRKNGIDYLAYSIIDAIVDCYFIMLEKLGEQIELVESDLLLDPTTAVVHEIQRLKRETIVLRKAVWPLREVINVLVRGDTALVQEGTKIYLRDVYDHTIQVIDSVETLRDILSEVFDIYLSSVGNKLNEIMKVLTIISTIFIPLTFIAGVYGMNFKYMPEIGWHLGYPMILTVMLSVSLYMIFYFKKKKWL
jgi:magnesium transporter